MNVVPLFDEFRLIERSEDEINGAWKGAHILLFFLAFVFGSFCTFCFHMLMYLFDEKCVLFPKLLSLTSLRHNVIYEFIPPNTNDHSKTNLPVDFLSTQWVEKSTCSLPTYVPLISGIFGLVWTTMFLMCSTGSRTLTGLQRPWRVLPPVFLFSLAMGCLCIYSSTVTHYGLQELCLKLGEITGSSTCTYTVNVATLTYERRIRGVYQATRLTILSAWLHTACWLLSALLALVRVLLVIDFQLVRISVQLHGDIDKILENHEIQIRTVSPEVWANDDRRRRDDSDRDHLDLKQQKKQRFEEEDEITELYDVTSDTLYFTKRPQLESELSLVPEERNRLARVTAYKTVPKDKQFIVKWLYDLMDTLNLPDITQKSEPGTSTASLSPLDDDDSGNALIKSQYGQEKISSTRTIIRPEEWSKLSIESEPSTTLKLGEVLETHNIRNRSSDFLLQDPDESVMNLTSEMRLIMDNNTKTIYKDFSDDNIREMFRKKSSLKTIGVQTYIRKQQKRELRVQLTKKNSGEESDSKDTGDTAKESNKIEAIKATQTPPKEKQD